MLAGTVALVKVLSQANDIDAKLREVVTLRVTILLRAPY
ncbi:hypothetical protein HDF11_004792 [Tunturiibacter psychrotolerans]